MSYQDKINNYSQQMAQEMRLFAKSQLNFWKAMPYFAVLSSSERDLTFWDITKKVQYITGNDHIYNYCPIGIDVISGELMIGEERSKLLWKGLLPDNILLRKYTEENNMDFLSGEKKVRLMYEEAQYRNFSIKAKWRQKFLKKNKIEIPHTILLLL